MTDETQPLQRLTHEAMVEFARSYLGTYFHPDAVSLIAEHALVSLLYAVEEPTPQRRNDARPTMAAVLACLARVVEFHDGWHEEGCRAASYGVDEGLPDDPSDADPECECGALDIRKEARVLQVRCRESPSTWRRICKNAEWVERACSAECAAPNACAVLTCASCDDPDLGPRSPSEMTHCAGCYFALELENDGLRKQLAAYDAVHVDNGPTPTPSVDGELDPDARDCTYSWAEMMTVRGEAYEKGKADGAANEHERVGLSSGAELEALREVEKEARNVAYLFNAGPSRHNRESSTAEKAIRALRAVLEKSAPFTSDARPVKI